MRFPKEESIVNGMGLPGDGIKAEVERLAARQQAGRMPKVPLIANLCTSASSTTEDEKLSEFEQLMTELYPYVQGFEINVSCPNQGGVCDMQKGDNLKKLLTALKAHNERLAYQSGKERKTMLVKISPLTRKEGEEIEDLSQEGLEMIARICDSLVDGITATNTSKEHNFKHQTQIIQPNEKIIT
jgi:dihydroorotate dehydrogenase